MNIHMDKALYNEAINILKSCEDLVNEGRIDEILELSKPDRGFGYKEVYAAVGTLLSIALGPQYVLDNFSGNFVPSCFIGISTDVLKIPSHIKMFNSGSLTRCEIKELYLSPAMEVGRGSFSLTSGCFHESKIDKIYVTEEQMKVIKHDFKNVDNFRLDLFQLFGDSNTEIIGTGKTAKDWVRDNLQVLEY